MELEIIPKARPNKKALKALREADLIVLGPGDLYTSIICNLVIDGVGDALRLSRAKKLYIVNLMTKHGQTSGLSAKGHLTALEKYLGKGVIDVCLINKTTSYPRGILARYKEEKAYPVRDDLNGEELKVKRGNFISQKIYSKPKSDKIRRSLIRHNSQKLAKAIISLL